MRAMLQRLTETASGLILRFPWAGWAGWIAFCVIALARVTPRRFELDLYRLYRRRQAIVGTRSSV